MSTSSSRPIRLLATLAGAAALASAQAAVTDIATAPLITSSPQEVKPNLMFILDDSGSMQWTYMPDQARNFDVQGGTDLDDGTGVALYGYRSYQCNGVYYNPAITYTPPVTSAGVSYANSSFTNAWTNGFDQAAGTVNLSTSFRAYTTTDNWFTWYPGPTNDTAQAAYYYRYTGTETTDAQRRYNDTGSTFYQECASPIGSAPGSGVFTRVNVGSTSGPGGTDERTNFANWYSYYRTRMLTMKTSVGQAFKTIGTEYRVGYMSINNAATNSFLNINVFDATQKTTWYSKLYGAVPSGGTGIRQSLSNAGRIYAGTLTSLYGTSVVDPVQYSCQKNFTMLSTDGYWNGAAGVRTDGFTAIGEQDGTEPRPFTGAGTADSLADVAMYYYKTDLRPALENNVLASNDDAATWQHMTTFTLGLGARGSMIYDANYPSSTAGDYFAVKTGATASATVCTWQAAGSVCNWPAPAADSQTAIDDLWHAAVNGRGRYFSAKDPATLADGLSGALQAIAALTSASATSATSSPNVTEGDNLRFRTSYTSAEWTGQLERRSIDLATGEDSATVAWQAKQLLDANTNRRILTFDAGSGNKVKEFLWANLNSAERAFFSLPWISSTSTAATPLTQFCASGDACLPAAAQTAAAGERLVNFLRGTRVDEGATTDLTKYFRQRQAVLGDLVNSRAVYVKRPNRLYTDTGYADFKAAPAQTSRPGTVYVGGNDGMLHAFDADTGAERWAYVPSLVLPTLFKLADKRYSVNHQYYVDGAPTIEDVRFSTDGAWHTILVGGLNRGGRGYYALDVTDPTNPRALWEFTNTNMGYSFGRPEITKLKNGTWVVLLTSGYNNVVPGDGKGYLYVLNAATGELLNTIATGVGDATTPSGLAQIRAWVDNGAYNNTALRVYGGDLFGNLWRFDVNGDIGAAGTDAQRLVTLAGPGGTLQPITTRPELGRVAEKPVVFVGTGRSLGVTDIYDTNRQSIYALKDQLNAISYGSPRAAGSLFVQQTFTNSTCAGSQPFCTAGATIRTSTSNAVNFNSDNGWFVDLPASRERIDSDMQLAFGLIGVASNVPSPTACVVGGSNFVNFIDYRTGGAVQSASGMVSIGGENLSTGLVFTIVTSGSGAGSSSKLTATQCKSDGNCETLPVPDPGGTPAVQRTSWRELPTEE